MTAIDLEQPDPKPNDKPAVWDLVRRDGRYRARCRTCAATFSGASAQRYCSDKCFFMGHVSPAKPSECWVWSGKKKGYARVERRRGHAEGAHRFSYQLFWGAIPDGMVVRHVCDNPPCANPFHLMLGTPAANSGDMVASERQARGERHGSAKLTVAQVLAIRGDTHSSHSALGRKYGVGHRTIGRIRAGTSWRMTDADMQERDRIGRERYGVPLQPHNGRDQLKDAYAEALDLCVYMRAAIYERDGK